MTYFIATDVCDIPEGKMRAVKVGGKNIVIANTGGSFYAVDAKCPLAHAPLSHGRLTDCTLTCPLHHATFNVKNGQNLSDAQILFLKMEVKSLGVYSVKIENDAVLVDVN